MLRGKFLEECLNHFFGGPLGEFSDRIVKGILMSGIFKGNIDQMIRKESLKPLWKNMVKFLEPLLKEYSEVLMDGLLNKIFGGSLLELF